MGVKWNAYFSRLTVVIEVADRLFCVGLILFTHWDIKVEVGDFKEKKKKKRTEKLKLKYAYGSISFQILDIWMS